MNKYVTWGIFISIFLLSCQQKNNHSEKKLFLWYDHPAEQWTEALPVGNGRMGAMVFGGVLKERIQLNEESIWSGGPIDRSNPEALANLEKVRNLLFEGKYAEGDRLAQEKIMGKRIDQGKHTYQTLGDLIIQFEGINEPGNYKRSLDLNTAIVKTEFESSGVKYTREVFSSAPDNLIIIQLTASEKGKLSISAYFERPGDAENISVGENQLTMTGNAFYDGRGTQFASVVAFQARNGVVTSEDTSITVKNADEIEIRISARTNYKNDNEVTAATKDIKNAANIRYNELKSRHIADYKELFNRVEFELNGEDTLNMPTSKRLERVKAGKPDPHLTELYFQFGRYLLISSSRPGNLPANLQGIWESTLTPPWNADYHININIQMNYWPALVANLEECQQPFFEFINGLRERGKITARETYGCRGFVAHHTTDLWQFTEPIGLTRYGMWPMGAAWCSDHFWEHFDYTGDKDFLEKKAYPVLKEAALFFVDYLVENPQTGLLVSGPSMSPENTFYTANGERAAVCMGPAMDHQIIRELFNNCIQSAEILNTDQAFADTLKMMIDKLTPSQIGADGRILEWSEELKEAEPGHRHMSHLYALYPGEEFTDPDDPKWMKASRKSIEERLKHGGGHTGWSRAWIINFFSRLKDGAKAYENLQALYAKSTHPNLFDNHPPFQIDGNFGATAGIAEMLLQSHNGVLQILPALPPQWKSGYIKGLRARGGYEVDIKWENAELEQLRILSLLGKPCKIMYKNTVATHKIAAGDEIVLDEKL